jgi:hydrogenase/urease accessory protein HupE
MKTPHRRSLLLAATLALPVLAHAHPGHDGDHDFVWDFVHLVENPLATIACLSLLVAAGWGVWRLVKGRAAAKTERAKRE